MGGGGGGGGGGALQSYKQTADIIYSHVRVGQQQEMTGPGSILSLRHTQSRPEIQEYSSK